MTQGVHMQTAQIEFSKELTAFIDEWKAKPGSLIMMLHRIQEEFTYIPREAAEKLSRSIGLPLAKIYGVITFYHYFKTTKPGKHRLAICLGTACYLKGAQDLIDEAQSILNIKGEEVTDDGLFSLDEVRCLGCCGLAPVLMIGNEIFGKVTKDELPEIIAKYRDK
jgi:NADH-quinone oxidoreductase subunit E